MASSDTPWRNDPDFHLPLGRERASDGRLLNYQSSARWRQYRIRVANQICARLRERRAFEPVLVATVLGPQTLREVWLSVETTPDRRFKCGWRRWRAVVECRDIVFPVRNLDLIERGKRPRPRLNHCAKAHRRRTLEVSFRSTHRFTWRVWLAIRLYIGGACGGDYDAKGIEALQNNRCHGSP